MPSQEDFGRMFNRKIYIPLRYKIRFNSNALHDLAFLSSYLSGSTFHLAEVRVHKCKFVLILSRICWEVEPLRCRRGLSYIDTPATLSIEGVKDIQWSFRGPISYVLSVMKSEQFEIRYLTLAENFNSTSNTFDFILGNDLRGWRLVLSIDREHAKVVLRDQIKAGKGSPIRGSGQTQKIP